jgi:hypothetical protein
MLRSEKEALDNYYMLERIDEQFTDTLDFDMYPSQIVLHGVQTLAKFIGDVNNVYVASGRVIPKKKEPYFFRNRLVGGESLFLASDVDSLTDALSYIYNWTTKGFAYRLPPVSDEVEEQMNVSVYNYISADEIPVIHVANSKNKILAYKYEDRVRFVVLIAK